MTILTAIQNVSAAIALNRPEAVFSSTEREHFELQVLANTAGLYIAKDYEWQALRVVGTLTGDGTKTAFDLPADYDRMLKEAEFRSSRYITALTHIIDSDHWLDMEIRQFNQIAGMWTLHGGQIHIRPAPAAGEAVKFFYMSKLWAKDDQGTLKDGFTKDSDTFQLSEKILELCMIWKWRAQKGLPYAQDQDNYEDAKEKLQAADKGSRIISVGRARRLRGMTSTYPVSIVP
ncbi:hypothetical protein G5V57_18725 [Nordella sp. HKS 07]|uniref:phage adaptor protein n=1 Tax=Nordella sp. HKS 07 TaxID=2712222 RepID=UPI0013E17603|nr:hypothetical protein [Nordella sp. HKS 07]QIG49567.1 hypothetical protein G5V57_18725 [Nordella sp. HKS 07]